MARIEAIVAGTGVIPMFGRSVLNEDDLHRMADQLRGQRVAMHLDHDLDQPIDVTVVSAEVRPGENDTQLIVAYDVPDAEVSKFDGRMGMSISFTRPLIAPDGDADSHLWLDPTHFTRAELAVASSPRTKKTGPVGPV